MSGHEKVRDEELARRLVVRRGARGNCTYDEGAKRELIELCQSGEVSVAKVALTYGINPNLLHNWITLNRRASMVNLPAPLREPSACVPLGNFRYKMKILVLAEPTYFCASSFDVVFQGRNTRCKPLAKSGVCAYLVEELSGQTLRAPPQIVIDNGGDICIGKVIG